MLCLFTIPICIVSHSFCSLSDDRSIASSKASLFTLNTLFLLHRRLRSSQINTWPQIHSIYLATTNIFVCKSSFYMGQCLLGFCMPHWSAFMSIDTNLTVEKLTSIFISLSAHVTIISRHKIVSCRAGNSKYL